MKMILLTSHTNSQKILYFQFHVISSKLNVLKDKLIILMNVDKKKMSSRNNQSKKFGSKSETWDWTGIRHNFNTSTDTTQKLVGPGHLTLNTTVSFCIYHS